jgi:hypothetical protein
MSANGRKMMKDVEGTDASVRATRRCECDESLNKITIIQGDLGLRYECLQNTFLTGAVLSGSINLESLNS